MPGNDPSIHASMNPSMLVVSAGQLLFGLMLVMLVMLVMLMIMTMISRIDGVLPSIYFPMETAIEITIIVWRYTCTDLGQSDVE